MMLTNQEKQWIKEMDKLSKRRPKSLIAYTTDGDYLVICKRGVSSDDVSEIVHLPVSAGCVLTDMHDDMDCGRR